MCNIDPADGSEISTNSEKGERAFLRRLAAETRADLGPHGFGDDLAPLELHAGGLVWSTDMLMDGVDFKSSKHAWRDIGHKAMAVNLSDCAASAAVPIAAVCAVSLNNDMSMQDALELYRGIRDCAAVFQCPITGGDTNSWNSPTVICITVAARTDEGRPLVTRSGARPGDAVFITGSVGGSIIGRHMRPQPRIDLALEINRRLHPGAMIDISDGLAVDLMHICEASGAGAVIDEHLLNSVVHADARLLAKKTGRPPAEHALHDGEDFELIVAAHPGEETRMIAKELGLWPIGEIIADSRVLLRGSDGRMQEIAMAGWEHFRE